MSLALPARAKLNLDLEVLSRRPDGFHDLRTTVQLIDLHDVLVVDESKDTQLTISGSPQSLASLGPLGSLGTPGLSGLSEPAPPGPSGLSGLSGPSRSALQHNDNSVLKAHAALERATNRSLPASFHLHKRIPPGSGMGGASSDAAATLKALKILFALRDVDLQPIAEALGSDVPFFLAGGRAILEGRGERITRLPSPHMCFAVAWPGIELSTRSVYAAWDETKGAGLRRAAERVEPRLKDFATHLGDGWRMTGSGSAFFKQTATRHEAEQAITGLECWRVVAQSVTQTQTQPQTQPPR